MYATVVRHGDAKEGQSLLTLGTPVADTCPFEEAGECWNSWSAKTQWGPLVSYMHSIYSLWIQKEAQRWCRKEEDKSDFPI
jgi:hypothetical protein